MCGLTDLAVDDVDIDREDTPRVDRADDRIDQLLARRTGAGVHGFLHHVGPTVIDALELGRVERGLVVVIGPNVMDLASPRNNEVLFAIPLVVSAALLSFAHGANDVANAVGPLAAIVGVIESNALAELGAKSVVPGWVLLLGAVGIVVGLATYGYKVIATIGKEITELTPSRGFAAELAAATTVVSASGLGLPISTTHTLVGAILGVGLARGIGALNLGMIGKIFLSWIITLPAGAILSIIFFFILRALFGGV